MGSGKLQSNQKSKTNIYCCYGTIWGSTQRTSNLLCEMIRKNVEKDGFTIITKSTQKEEKKYLEDADIIVLSSSSMGEFFRFNVLKFVERNIGILKQKLTALLILHAPYMNKDFLIKGFEEKTGLRPDFSLAMGGVIDFTIKGTYENLLKKSSVKLPPGEKKDTYGEISIPKLENFSKKISTSFLNSIGARI